MDMDSDSHTEGASPMEYDIEMLDEAGKPYVKHILIQQWMLWGEDESRLRYPIQMPKFRTLGPPDRLVVLQPWTPQMRGIGVVQYAL